MYLVVVPGIAWVAVLLELSRPGDVVAQPGGRTGVVAVVAALAVAGAALAGSVDGPLRPGTG